MKNNVKRFLILSLLTINVFALVADGQTRRRKPIGSRRASKAKAPVPKAPVPCPPTSAVTTASGLTYVVTRRGTGKALKAGETVSVHYTGLLGNGTKFDSSLDRGQPLEFELGAGRVIKGWDEGLAQLKVGDQATFIIPPQLGYGDTGAGGVIPPNATLVFIVEVIGGGAEASPSAN
ncbi:MAG: FKBP-type peptidyl-prolyl cis-trans isomerase [Pyrinomonadaceae bacterium]